MSPNRSNGSKWVQKSTNVPEQVQTGLNESKQFLMGQKKSKWVQMCPNRSFGVKRVQMGPNGFILNWFKGV